MRNSKCILLRSHEVFEAEMTISAETSVRYFDGRKPLVIAINNKIVQWGKRPLFQSEWVAHFERGYKTIYPLSAHEIPNVAEERLFSLLNDCDATTGIQVSGARSIHRTVEDIDALIKRVEYAYRLKKIPITAINAMRRLLRVHSPVARGILERAPEPRALITAALPHYAAQASAARDWLARRGPLAMDMTGAAILESL